MCCSRCMALTSCDSNYIVANSRKNPFDGGMATTAENLLRRIILLSSGTSSEARTLGIHVSRFEKKVKKIDDEIKSTDATGTRNAFFRRLTYSAVECSERRGAYRRSPSTSCTDGVEPSTPAEPSSNDTAKDLATLHPNKQFYR